MRKHKNFEEFEAPSCFGPPKYEGVYAVVMVSEISKRPRIVFIGASENIYRCVMAAKHIYRVLCARTFYPMLVYTIYRDCENYKEEKLRLIKKYAPVFNKRRKNASA